jgi:hypothetical protein
LLIGLWRATPTASITLPKQGPLSAARPPPPRVSVVEIGDLGSEKRSWEILQPPGRPRLRGLDALWLRGATQFLGNGHRAWLSGASTSLAWGSSPHLFLRLFDEHSTSWYIYLGIQVLLRGWYCNITLSPFPSPLSLSLSSLPSSLFPLPSLPTSLPLAPTEPLVNHRRLTGNTSEQSNGESRGNNASRGGYCSSRSTRCYGRKGPGCRLARGRSSRTLVSGAPAVPPLPAQDARPQSTANYGSSGSSQLACLEGTDSLS